MKLSKLSQVYEFGGKDKFYYVFYHSILNNSFLFNEKEYERLLQNLNKGIKSETISKLEKSHILVSDKYKEKKFIEFLKQKYNSNKFDLEIIYLIFNSNCNLKCKYCYVEKSTKPTFNPQSMNKEIFDETINCIERLIKQIKKKNPKKESLNFIFYGSEPLMSKELVSKSLERITKICNKNKVKPEFNITTNGTLFDDEIIKQLKKFNVKISVSLDGSKKINDSMRITQSNKGTYNKIVSNLKKLNKNKIPFGISCTIGPHNVNNLKQNIKLFKKLGAVSIGFNILLNARYYKIPQVSLNKLNNSLISASSLANSQNIYEDRVQRKIRAFNNQIPRLKDCGGVGNQLVFFPNGDIGVCEAYLGNRKYVVGNVKTLNYKDLEKNKIIKKWTQRYPLNMEECIYCPAIGVCGGGCPFNAETRMLNLYKLDKPFCVHTNKIFEWLLKKSVSEKTKEKDLFMRNISFMFTDKKFPKSLN